MNVQLRNIDLPPDETAINREARRILRRLCEPGACLAVATEMDKAVVVRETDDGRTIRTAITERPFVEAMALKNWITSKDQARISRYYVTAAGRAALKHLLAEDEETRAVYSDANSILADQRSIGSENDPREANNEKSRRIRYNLAESPVAAMARRKDRDGKPFLSVDLVTAAERLREDFELAQMGPKTQNWECYLTGTDAPKSEGKAVGTSAAKQRVSTALGVLGPGLGDVALRVCCFLEGLETAEKRMGWSARSGKVVLRIALQRLKNYYDGLGNSALIG